MAAALAAMLLCVLLCGMPVFAADTADPESNTASDVPEEETFFDKLEAGNGVGTTLFVSGLVLIAVGAVGFVCLFVWQRASKNRDRVEEDREDIFDEIQQAEMRNRRQRTAAQQAREYEERIAAREEDRAPRQTERDYDPYAVTGETPLVPGRADYTVEQPIIPSTPVSLQPEAVQRAQPAARARTAQTASRPRAAEAVSAARPAPKRQEQPVRNTQPASKPAAQPSGSAAAKPAVKPSASPKFDLDDILREVRESKSQSQ